MEYKTVFEISTSMGNAEIAEYKSQNLVCPSTLKQGLVTTIAVDNIDQSTPSMSVTSALHGTAISVTQHPFTSSNEIEVESQTIEKLSSTSLDYLPESVKSVKSMDYIVPLFVAVNVFRLLFV